VDAVVLTCGQPPDHYTNSQLTAKREDLTNVQVTLLVIGSQGRF
jgi:hypothetical protein